MAVPAKQNPEVRSNQTLLRATDHNTIARLLSKDRIVQPGPYVNFSNSGRSSQAAIAPQVGLPRLAWNSGCVEGGLSLIARLLASRASPSRNWVRLAACLALIGAPALRAQSSAVDGVIQGVVVDTRGLPSPNASIEVVNGSISLRRRTLTDESGLFRFPLLPLGTYSVEVRAPGFARVERIGIRLEAGAVVTTDFNLSVANIQQTIAVERGAPVLEGARADLGTNIGANSVRGLPLVSRNNLNFVLLQPGISGHGNPQFGVPGKVNTAGFTNRVNYQLDGSNNTESDRSGARLMTISNTWVDEVQQADGFPAEFGNTTGTVYNAVTRSGSNDLHAELAYLMRRTAFISRSPLLRDSEDAPDANMDNPYGNAGFPVLPDRLFAFFGYEWLDRDLPQPITVDPAVLSRLGLPPSYTHPIPREQANQFIIGRADWQWNDRNRVFFRYNGYKNNSPDSGATSSLQVLSKTYTLEDQAPALAAQWIASLGPGLSSELRFQAPSRTTRDRASKTSGRGPSYLIPGVISFGGSESLGYRFNEKTPEVAGNLSYDKGAHAVKTGFSLRYVLDNNTYPAFAQYTFATVEDYLSALNGGNRKSYQNYKQTFGRPTIGYDSLFLGLYVEDRWRVRRDLTLSAGLRWDLYRVPGGSNDSAFTWSKQFSTATGNFGPRLGLAWSPDGSQRTVLRLNGGIFYDPPQTDLYRRALQDNGRPRFFTLATGPDSGFAPDFPGVLRTPPPNYGQTALDVTTVDPHFRPTRAAEWNAQLNRQLTENTYLALTYSGVAGTALPVYRNINVVPSGATLADGRPIYGPVRVWPQFNNILSAESVGNSSYHAFTATLRRRMAAYGEYSISYTWSHAIDDAPEQNVLDSLDLLPADPANRARDRGDSLTDRRHAVTAYGVFEPRFRMVPGLAARLANHNRLSFVLTASSGDALNLGSNRVLNGDASIQATLQRPLFVGRNTLRAPALVQANIRYGRTLPIWERLETELFVECSNLFNRNNLTGLDTIANVDQSGRIVANAPMTATSALESRTFQIGFKWSY